MFNPIEITQFIGKTVWYLPTCTSTNDMAKHHTETRELLEGTVIITSHQTAGRGQRGNTWQAAPHQNLTFSLILQPTFLAIHEQFALNIAVTLGITDALRQIVPNIKIKWSNDIYIQEKKLGGILIENILQQRNIRQSIIGIGLNINQLDFKIPTATSLALVTQKEHLLQEVLGHVLHSIERRYLQLRQQNPVIHQQMKEQYLQRLYWYEEERTFMAQGGEEFKGKIIGVSPEGYLVMVTSHGVRQFGAKEVVFVA